MRVIITHSHLLFISDFNFYDKLYKMIYYDVCHEVVYYKLFMGSTS